MSKSCKQNGIRYDPRIKLLQVLIIGVLVFTLTGKKYEVLLFLSVFVYGMISGIYKTCFNFLALYIVLFMVAEIRDRSPPIIRRALSISQLNPLPHSRGLLFLNLHKLLSASLGQIINILIYIYPYKPFFYKSSCYFINLGLLPFEMVLD